MNEVLEFFDTRLELDFFFTLQALSIRIAHLKQPNFEHVFILASAASANVFSLDFRDMLQNCLRWFAKFIE